MTTAAQHRRGLLLMVGATICWATAGVLVRTQSLTDGWELTFWRSFFMVLFMVGVLTYQRGSGVVRHVIAVGWPGVVSGFLWSIMFVSFIVALSMTTVADTLVVSSFAPFMSALFGWIFLSERVAPRTWIAMAAAISGILIIFGDSLGRGALAGTLIASAIPICFGLNVVLLRKMHAEVDMVPTVLIAGLFSCAMTLPVALPFNALPTDFPNFIALGFVQLGLGCVFMVIASRYLAAAEVGLLAELETILGVLATWAFVGEVPSKWTWMGGSIVVIALAANAAYGLYQRNLASPTTA